VDQIPFSHDTLDRADPVRLDDEAQSRFWGADDAWAYVFWRGKPLLEIVDDTLVPVRLPVAEAPEPWLKLFLGDGPVLAIALDPAEKPPRLPGRFADLRMSAASMSLEDAATLGTARGVFAWHRTHGFCAKCGGTTVPTHAGWRRRCTQCGAEHFPRVDPVVIALVTRHDRVLLGRGPTWPEGFYSCLAGFMEPGETPESATRREVFEEAGVRIGAVRYLGAQPWPFPRSLMLGMHAEAETEAITLDEHELADARWFSREEVRAMLGGEGTTIPPTRAAIAHHLLVAWLGQK
jgi:NAD+ diphosphatase